MTDHLTPEIAPPKNRKRLYAALCLCFPLVLLGAAEWTLSSLGFGGHPPLCRRITETPEGDLYMVDVSKARSYFFANRDRPGYNHPAAFFLPKPSETLRILMVGESALQGYPQPRHLGSSAFLAVMLEEVWPGRRVEVLNLGTTAVASFPVMEMAEDGSLFDPDLVVVYTGHNEFFGAYGVASSQRAGSHPRMLTLHRWMLSTAIAQALDRLWTRGESSENRTLMELMVGQGYTPPDHWRRDAAARNLHHHVGRIAKFYRSRDVPVMICTLPVNERDLAPLGNDRLDDESAKRLKAAIRMIETDSESAVSLLKSVMEDHPSLARAHYYLGRVFHRLENETEALRHFELARDLDTMPWRITSPLQESLRRVANEYGTLFCDVESTFRAHSPGGAVGWELMDDHVHLSLKGQSLLARSVVEALTRIDGPLRVDATRFAGLPDHDTLARRLGENPYDRYAVHHQMRILFNIPFMKQTNPTGWERFERMARAFEQSLSPDLQEIVRQWQGRRPHAGGTRPITGMIARGLMRRGQFAEAQPLLEVARRAVMPYTSWHMEYVYFDLACREKMRGRLNEAEQQMARREIERGHILLSHGRGESGLTERYTGRLHQLLGEFAEAIPFLQASQSKLTGFDLVATDQALFVSYVHLGKIAEARALVIRGVEHSGHYAGYYRTMLTQLPVQGDEVESLPGP